MTKEEANKRLIEHAVRLTEESLRVFEATSRKIEKMYARAKCDHVIEDRTTMGTGYPLNLVHYSRCNKCGFDTRDV